MSIFNHYQDRYESTQQEEFSLQEYLDICKNDPTAYATAAERMLMAIGEPNRWRIDQSSPYEDAALRILRGRRPD